MSAVAHLAKLLAGSQAAAGAEALDLAPATDSLDALIERLTRQVASGSGAREPVDLQREAVQRFWDTRRLETLRDARLIAFGLGLPAGPGGASLLEDKGRLEAVLQGADGWLDNPRWFRRCFQGLAWSYFNAWSGVQDEPASHPAWLRLRDYLQRRVGALRDPEVNPDWVETLAAHPSLFGQSPCADFVPALLRGERAELDAVCERLGIGESSWFLRDLVQAQVTASTQLGHEDFVAALPAMLQLLGRGGFSRDAGLAMLLERYARIPQSAVHAGLRDAVVLAWGSPWKPVDPMRWLATSDAARSLVAGWQSTHLIERFCLRLGDAGARRAAFWKRYAPSIRAIEFALPVADAEEASAAGLVTPLLDGSPAAMVIELGCALLVAFADPAEGLWAYDLRRGAPFEMDRPVVGGLDLPNSLRRSGRSLFLLHQDGLNGWRQWEQAFEAALKDHFGLRVGQPIASDARAFVDLSDGAIVVPGTAPDDSAPAHAWHTSSRGEDVHWQTAEAMSVPYSRPDLEVLARVHALTLKEGGEGRGRVRVDPRGVDPRIARVLERWGFTKDVDGDWRR